MHKIIFSVSFVVRDLSAEHLKRKILCCTVCSPYKQGVGYAYSANHVEINGYTKCIQSRRKGEGYKISVFWPGSGGISDLAK